MQMCHGDLTLDNIFFRKNYLTIFDWEHFQYSENIFFGYDLLYMLLSGIILPGEKKFDKEFKKKFKKLYKTLYNSRIKPKYLNNPIISVNSVITNSLLKIFIKSPTKFITFDVSKSFIKRINNFFHNEII